MAIIRDSAVKKVVGDAEAHGFYDDAILVVASDNGGCPQFGAYNYPLRGQKYYLFDDLKLTPARYSKVDGFANIRKHRGPPPVGRQ